jgi:hypothetical protein
MNTPSSSADDQSFIDARSARTIAGKAANRWDNEAPGLPVALKTQQGVSILVLFFGSSGDPAAPSISPPTFSVELDSHGTVLQASPMTSQQLSTLNSAAAQSSVGTAEKLSVEAYIPKHKRFLEISPAVWSAFRSNADASNPAVAALVAEYWTLFATVTRSYDSNYYIHSSPDFFAWVRKVAQAH